MDDVLANTTICTAKQAEDFLNQHNTGYLLNLENSLDEMFVRRNEWVDFIQIQNDINRMLQEIYNNFLLHSEEKLVQMALKISLDCVIFNKLHDFLMPLLHQQFEEEDKFFFSKSTELSNANITAEQLGAPEDYAIPLLAAVVELASLDNHKSPLEKLHCLCTTYDLIFAELKTALIDIISRYSDAESEIPVINNSEIIPILMIVVIRSKLIHLYSNFYYIETFFGSLNQKDNIRHILSSFREAIERLQVTTNDSLKPSCEKVCKDLDLIKLIKVSSEVNAKLQQIEEVITPLDGQMLRITDLIVTSTNENHPVL